MELDTVVTLEGNENYYLADQTVQNDVKYFLANRLDEEEELTTESLIFEQIIIDEEFYLEEVTDEQKVKYLATIFTSNLISDIEELEEE